MLETAISLISLMVFALVIQEHLKVPLPITLIGTVFTLSLFHIDLLDINSEGFDEMLLLLLPLLLMGDVMNLKTEDLKKHWRSVVSTAVVAVGLSIILGVLLTHYMLPHFDIPIAAMVALMAMVVATDPVTVGSIFGNAKLPHKLKFLAESESLFNDATAFAIFSVAIMAMNHPMGSTEILISLSIATIGALVVGTFVGGVGIYILKLSDDPVTETGILIALAYIAFYLAEHFGFASIFAIVVSMGFANALITSRDAVTQDNSNPESVFAARQESKLNRLKNLGSFMSIQHLKATKNNHATILSLVGFGALFANVILFASISELINITLLKQYWLPIVSVFIFTTLIRAFVLGQFAWVSNMSSKMQNVSLDWWTILTFAGVKGGLSILMVHMIPETFEYKELFEAIVIGNIILSIFVYAPAMILTIKLRQKQLSVI